MDSLGVKTKRLLIARTLKRLSNTNISIIFKDYIIKYMNLNRKEL